MNILLKCPHCDMNILESDLLEHNSVIIKSFLDNKIDEQKNILRSELSSKLRSEFNNELRSQQLNFDEQKSVFVKKAEQDQQDSIQKLNIINNDLQTSIRILEANKEKDLEIEMLKQTQFIKEQYEKKEKDLEIEMFKQTQLIKEQYEKQISQLQTKNDENRIINNKIKGENFELEVYSELNRYFPLDKIEKITDKGDKADFSQIIKVHNQEIGKIIYEVKSGEWKNTWESKLQGDMAKVSGRYGILVAASFEDEYPGMYFKISNTYPDIFLASPETFVFVAQLLRVFMSKESSLRNSFDGTQNFKEKIDKFNIWKDSTFLKAEKDIYSKLEKIATAESSILNQVEQIGKARSAILESFKKNIESFIQQYVI